MKKLDQIIDLKDQADLLEIDIEVIDELLLGIFESDDSGSVSFKSHSMSAQEVCKPVIIRKVSSIEDFKKEIDNHIADLKSHLEIFKRFPSIEINNDEALMMFTFLQEHKKSQLATINSQLQKLVPDA